MIINIKDKTKAKRAYKWLNGKYDFCTTYKGVEPFGEYKFGILLKTHMCLLQELERMFLKLVLV